MRDFRGSVQIACGALLLSLSGSASGQLLVAAPSGEEPAVEHAELAYAVGNGSQVTWLALRLSGRPLAVVAALPSGAAVDAAPDAWFEALEATASPRVLLPRGAVDCGDASSFVEVAWPRARGTAPDELELQAPEDVAMALVAQGLSLTRELPPAASYVLWSWPASLSPLTTRTLRVQGGATPLPFLPGSRFPVLASAVTRGPATYPAEVDGGALQVTFVSGPGKRSDYFSSVASWLDARPEPLLEARSRGLIFDWSIHADSVSVTPLLRAYARRAAAELDDVDEAACITALGALRTSPAADAAREACGSASDALSALLAADPELATLQRFVLNGEGGVDPALLSGGGEPKSPLLRAAQLDDAACPAVTQPPIVIEPTPRTGGDGQPRGGGATVEETVVVEEHAHEVDCGGGAYVESDGHDVSSDSSSSSSSDADCSSDTSSSSEPDEADCSSDTSSSSEPDEADCSSDTSNSSDANESGCDGGPGTDDSEATGYDGDTCTGSAAPPRTQKASAALAGKRPQKPKRLRLSSWSLAWAAFVLPFRRRKRAP